MIIWNASVTALLTGHNAAGEQSVVAHDHRDPTTAL
jgi:hypothetical protein